MPRKARVLVPNCPHHVVQRGHNRKTIFVTNEDFRYYLANLKEWKDELGIKLYAWCLMTNHIHLIVEPGEDPMVISQLMKRVNGRQTAYVNKLEGRSGSLWEGRYKASPIQRDNYLLSCCRYVELNPVRAKMVAQPEDYLWSSYQERMVYSKQAMLDTPGLFEALGNNDFSRKLVYQKFVQAGISDQELKFISSAFKRNQLTGNDRFVREIEEKIGLRIERRGRGRPSKDGK